MRNLVVPLSEEEFIQLRDRALRELRHPRNEARLILRSALDMGNHDRQEREGEREQFLPEASARDFSPAAA